MSKLSEANDELNKDKVAESKGKDSQKFAAKTHSFGGFITGGVESGRWIRQKSDSVRFGDETEIQEAQNRTERKNERSESKEK